MHPVSRRELLGLFALAGLYPQVRPRPPVADLHRQLLDLAAAQEAQRRARFLAVKTAAGLSDLRRSLRESFLDMLGAPAAAEAPGPPPSQTTGRLRGDGYVVEKLVFESAPGHFVSALLYRPEPSGPGDAPGVLSPCGHSPVGKADGTYQTLHINLAKRGYVVLTYDPIGQGERSQYWDAARGRSRFDLTCGEHCVLGNPLYLLGTSLARYRVRDGTRALDYLAAAPGVDASRIGCVGNSGGGTLTAYIAAVDERVKVPVIGCYITTLPRRMANRIEADPSADPEQDPFGFVSRGIDHAGLLALTAPRPTLVCAAAQDFFPIEGTRETFAEARRLYALAGAEDRIGLVEAPSKHGLTKPLREATYAWFDRWLKGGGGDRPAQEFAVTPRPAGDLLACPDGQVGVSFRSRPLLSLVREEFRAGGERPRVPLKDLLRPGPLAADFRLTGVAAGARDGTPLVVCLNGNEAQDWGREGVFLRALEARGYAVQVLDTRGVGLLRVQVASRGGRYADPLSGVEENLAYNAFLVGESLLALRVADVRAAVAELSQAGANARRPVVLCGRRDSALVACLAAALEPRVDRVAVEDGALSLWPLFEPEGQAVNAAGILPAMLRDFGDVTDVLAEIAPRKVLAAAPRGDLDRPLPSVRSTPARFTDDPRLFTDWVTS